MVPLTDLPATTREVADRIHAAWHEVVDRSAFIGGPFVEAFEDDWARYCGTRAAVGVGNGTDAIVLALRGLGIGPGDEVLVPANTIVATAEAVVLAGAVPRFVDVDPVTLLVTPETLSGGLNDRTAAVIVVHLYGNIPAMDEIQRWAEARQLALIEDAAQAHGATRLGKKAGSFGAVGCFSFYPGKNLGAFGDGGAVVTDDEALAARIRSLSNHGRSQSHTAHTVVGTNSRLDGLQAAVLSCKLPLLDTWNEARRAAVATYRRLLVNPDVRLVEADCVSAVYQNVALVPGRDGVRAHLTACGIETGVHYPVPCHRHPPYQGYAPEPLPVAERTAGQILSLPLFPHITEAQVQHVCGRLNELGLELSHAG
jgi:dTDP-4-amino-4,6-dideoxygalactose transaminase